MTHVLSDYQRLLLEEMRTNESTYRRAIGQEWSEAYADLNRAFNSLVANLGYLTVNDVKKHDPYVWGGIANGMAGPAAGAYTAISTAQENERADAENARRQEANRQNQINRSKLISSVPRCLSRLDTLVTCNADARIARGKWREKKLGEAQSELASYESRQLSKADLDQLKQLQRTLRGLASMTDDAKPLVERAEACERKATERLEQTQKRKRERGTVDIILGIIIGITGLFICIQFGMGNNFTVGLGLFAIITGSIFMWIGAFHVSG